MADTLFTDASGNVPGTVVVAAWLNDVDKNTYNTLTAVAGTNTITANGPLPLIAYTRGMKMWFLPVVTNTSTVTLNVNALGSKAITKAGASPLVAGDLVAGTAALIFYDGAQWQLTNPQTIAVTGVVPIANGGTGATAAPQALINLGAIGRLLNVQRFTASGTYTPTAGTTTIIVEAIGGGGAGGGGPTTAAGQVSTGGGGGSGGYTVGKFAVPAPTAVTIGAGGIPVAGAIGGAGGTTSLGALITALGGAGGVNSSVGSVIIGIGGAGAVASGTGGNILANSGSPGGTISARSSDAFASSGQGAPGPFGGGASGIFSNTQTNGTTATLGGYGGGASGGATWAGSVTAGGSGAPGILIVYEYS